MRTRTALAAIAAVLLITAGACGGDDDATTDQRPDIEDEATPTPLDTTLAPTPTAVVVEIEPARLTYTVQQGDLLGSIANTFGVPLGALISVNDMDNPDLISIGQEIIIPTEEEVAEWEAAQDAAAEAAPTPEPDPDPTATPAEDSAGG